MFERVLEGRFLGFVPKFTEDGQSSFWFQTQTVVERIELPPDTLPQLHKGQRARIFVEDADNRLTARLILPMGAQVAPLEPGRIGKIQICMHKNCCQNGARELKTALERTLKEQGGQIVVEPVGCMDHCKKGPNVRILPVNRVFHRMTPIGMVAILHRYFPKKTSLTA